MKNVVAWLMFALLPSMLAAQPIPVQTGEHADFTRIVIRLPDNADWDFGREFGGYALRLPVTDGYNLDRFFDLIPRTRVTAVSQEIATGVLRLSVECLCRATAFVAEQEYLVIDIADGLPDPQSPLERRFAPSSESPERQAADFRLPLLQPKPVPSRFLLPFGAEDLILPDAPTVGSGPDAFDALERMVVESLGRGLSAGILAPDPAPAAMPRRELMPNAQVPGILVRDNRDRFDRAPEDTDANDTNTGDCVPDDFVDLKSWGNDRPFYNQRASLQPAIFHDIDQFDPDAIVRFARLHLHFGLGREAGQILALDGVNSQEREFMGMLAAIIDDEPGNVPATAQFANCPTMIALWGFLGAPADNLPGKIDRAAVLQTFKDLPIGLQQHLGPRLAQRFSAIGDLDAASQALANAQRVAPDAIETRLATATLAEQQGNSALTFQTLTDLVQTNRRLTPAGMVRYLEDAHRLNETVPVEMMVLADALRFEAAMTPAAGDLAFAQIENYVRVNDFDTAAFLIEEEKAALGFDRVTKAQVDLGLAAAERMDDAAFVQFAYRFEMPAYAPGLQETWALRLIDLGFPDRALQLLSQEPVDPSHQDGRYLQALAYLALQNPDAALGILRNDQSDRARALQQAAREMRAGNSDALGSLATPDTVQTLWRNGEWASLAQSDDQLISDAAAAILNRDSPAFDEQQPITTGRQLLDQAAQSRDLLDSLLERFAPPDTF